MGLLVKDISKRRATARGEVNGKTIERWLASMADEHNVINYGAVGNGTHDDLAAFNRAYAALPNDGGIIRIPTRGKTYAFSATWNVGDGTADAPSTKQNVFILADGLPTGGELTANFAAKFKFISGGSGPILKINGPITCCVRGLFFDPNFLGGGLEVVHPFRSRFQDIYVGNYTTTGIKLTNYAGAITGIYTGGSNNIWENFHVAEPGNTTCTAMEIGLAAATIGTTNDINRNVFRVFSLRSGNNANSTGLKIGFSDILHFENGLIHSGVAATACTAKLFKVVAPTGNTTFPQVISLSRVCILGDGVTNYDIDAAWTNNASALGDGGIYFCPFLKADVESCTNIYPTHTRLYGYDEENNYFGGSSPANFMSIAATTPGLKTTNKTDSASVLAAILRGARGTPAANDEVYLALGLNSSTGVAREFGRIYSIGTTVTNAAEVGAMAFGLMAAGTMTKVLSLTNTALGPVTNNGLTLGVSGTAFGSAFFASGAVLNFNASDVLITHSANTLTGTGGQLVWSYNGAATTAPIKTTNTTDNAQVLGLTVEGNRATPANNDSVYVDFKLTNSAAAQFTFGRMLAFASDITSGSEDGYFRWVLPINTTLTGILDLTGTKIGPVDNDGVALGTAGLSFSDLFLASGAVIGFNNGNVTITHSAGVLAIVASTGVTVTGALTAGSATAITAGGSLLGHLLSSTAAFGVFCGSGAPTISAAKGSLYLRSDGSGVADRMYVNTNGSTTWTAVATAA